MEMAITHVDELTEGLRVTYPIDLISLTTFHLSPLSSYPVLPPALDGAVPEVFIQL